MLGTTVSEAPPGLWEKIAAALPHDDEGAGTVRGGPAPQLGGMATASPGPTAVPGPTASPGPTAGATQIYDIRDAASRRDRSRPRNRWALVGAGAVAAALIAFLGVQVHQLRDQVHGLEQAVGPARVLDGPHLTVQLSSPAHSPAATVVVSPSGTAYWLASSLPRLSADKTYQMWGLVHGKPVSLGLLGPRPGVVGSFRVETDVTQLMVTAEPRGGTPLPTTPVLAQGYVGTA